MSNNDRIPQNRIYSNFVLDVPMQLNLGLFSFNGACGYIEKPAALCQSRSSFDPRARTNVENVVSYEINIKVLSGQFLCQDREPTWVDVHAYGMYGEIAKRHEYHIRAKRWNGFQAIYDDTDYNSNEFAIRSLKVILPEMAALRFAVSTDDGSFVGQSFIPIAYLRPGYRHIVLRNQMNIPVQSSNLFIYVTRKICINPKDEEFAAKLVEPLSGQCANSQKVEKDSNNEPNFCDDSCSTMLVRFHNPLPREVADNTSRRPSSTSLDETNWYQAHLTSASRLHEKKELSKVLSVDDIESKEVFKRKQSVQAKLRSVSVDHQKVYSTDTI